MKKISGVYDLGQIVIESVQRLIKKKVSVNEVKAVIAGINSVQAGLALRQEQARLSGARVNGDVIMDLKIDPNARPTPVALTEPASKKSRPRRVATGIRRRAASRKRNRG